MNFKTCQILIVAALSGPSWSLVSAPWNNLTFIQWAAVVATAILTLGVVIEYWGKIRLLASLGKKCLLGRSTPFERCVFRKVLLHSVAPILVVIGIAGEVIFEGRGFILEDQHEEQARRTVGSLHDKVLVVSSEADALKKRLDIASTRMSDLEEAVDIQGPRWRLIAKAAPDLVDELSPFAGQRVILAVSGSESSVDSETRFTWGDIASVLNADGARWKVERGGIVFLDRWPAEQGIKVTINSAAPPGTKEAARVLSEGLTKILPPSPGKMLITVEPDFATKWWNRRWVEDKENPTIWVLNSPELIVITIGAHPQQQTNEKTKRGRSKTPNP